MDTGSIEWDIAFSLRHKARIRLKHDIEFEAAARAVADHLRLAGWEFTRRPPAPLHSTTRFLVSHELDECEASSGRMSLRSSLDLAH